jgi:hypothetical protein
MFAYFLRAKKELYMPLEKSKRDLWYLLFLLVKMLIKQFMHKYGNQNYFPKEVYKERNLPNQRLQIQAVSLWK